MTSERDELAEEKTGLEEKLMALQSQTHELQVRSMARVCGLAVVICRPNLINSD